MTRSVALALLAAACRGERAEPPVPEPTPAVAAAPTAPPDSLVRTTPSGAEVWLVEGRAARDSAGKECYEWGVEIRRDSVRIRVPLLYTGAPLDHFGPAAFEAELWRDCRPMAAYRIDLASGRPTKIRDIR